MDLADSVVNGFFDITWKSGVQIILLLAAVNHISPSSYEAADIEGATAWEKLWKITIPMISPTILVVVIYSIIDSFTDYNNQIMRMIDEYAGNINYEYSTTIGLVYFFGNSGACRIGQSDYGTFYSLFGGLTFRYKACARPGPLENPWSFPQRGFPHSI